MLANGSAVVQPADVAGAGDGEGAGDGDDGGGGAGAGALVPPPGTAMPGGSQPPL
jgi:hypothetical protein